LNGLTHRFEIAPPFGLGQRSSFHNSDDIADLARAVFIMDRDPFMAAYGLLVLRVCHQPFHDDHSGFVHGRADHFPFTYFSSIPHGYILLLLSRRSGGGSLSALVLNRQRPRDIPAKSANLARTGQLPRMELNPHLEQVSLQIVDMIDQFLVR